MVHNKRTARDNTGRKTRGKIGKEFTAVVVQAGSRADHDLAVEHARTPCDAESRCHAPLTACESVVADSLAGEILVVAGNDESGGSDLIAVKGVQRGIKIVDAAVLFREPAVPVVEQSNSHIKVGA